MNVHRSAVFLDAYGVLPHRLVNGLFARLSRAERPRWCVARAIDAWVRSAGIDLDDFECRDYVSLDDFFLRRLRPGARPLTAGFVSPVDGVLFAAGRIDLAQPLRVKGQTLSLHRVVNGAHHDLDLEPYDGGSFAAIFLTPHGYHRVHMPEGGVLEDVRWISGRYFPQNEDALRRIARVYERNERATLRFRANEGEWLLVMVGASLVGGIHLTAAPRAAWVGPHPLRLARPYAKGEELGHFAFGSTVVVLRPRGAGDPVPVVGTSIKLGERLFHF